MSRAARMRVVTPHRIPEREPIRITPGQEVVAGERDTTWPAFVFITTTDGKGWVPARHLAAPSGATVVVLGYDTTELPTTHGEELDVLEADEESGWLWCRNSEGREGWVPVSTLETID